MNNSNQFTIRVYGILINGRDEVLLSDEFHFGVKMTKFPGGGMHYGEGPVDCLKREFMEEIGQEPLNIRHLYTTDFFQPTALVHPPKQLISIYYSVNLADPDGIPATDKVFDFEEIEDAQAFRWVALDELSPEDLTFPIDRRVAEMIRG